MSRECHVYIFVEDDEPFVKIGVADDPRKRLATIQCGNARPMGIHQTFPCPTRDKARDIEKRAHSRLSEFRCSGEWFSVGANWAGHVVGHLWAEVVHGEGPWPA